MIHLQILLTDEQIKSLRQLSKKKGKSMSELIRNSIDAMLTSETEFNQEEIYRKAFSAAGCIHEGPPDIACKHDDYLTEAFEA